MEIVNLPFDILNLILEYYGKIKYNHKKAIYINIIHKNDYRYNIIEKNITNKNNLINNFKIGNNEIKYWIDIYYKNNLLTKGLIFSKKLL